MYSKYMQRTARGFTLVELLIVAAILAALATITLLAFGNQSEKAKDVERKSDLRQYQAALETYANRSGGVYPVEEDVSNLADLCGDLRIDNCPDDPDSTNNYKYRSDSSGIKFVLWAVMQAKATDNVFIVCSDGRVGEKTVTDFVGGGGVSAGAACPL